MMTNAQELNDNDRESLIRNSITTMKDKGISLTAEQWGLVWDRKNERFSPQKNAKCCALGCLLLVEQDKQERIVDWKILHLEHILQVDTQWIRDFQSGFDGHPKQNNNNTGSFEMGILLRAELTPEVQLSLV